MENMRQGMKGDEIDIPAGCPTAISSSVFLIESRIGMGQCTWLHFPGPPTGRSDYLIKF